MKKFNSKLDTWHIQFINNTYSQIFTAFVRCLLAVGFIPPSLPKIKHIHFTTLPDDNPVGHYFNALYDTGYYYDFLGWMQLLTGLLLLLPWTAHIGALVFFPIILNIAVLTSSVGFQGTWVVTLLMLVAGIYLLFWEYDRLKNLLFQSRIASSRLLRNEKWLIPLFFGMGGIALLTLMVYFGIANLHKWPLIKLLPLILGGFVFGVVVYLHHLKMKSGKIET